MSAPSFRDLYELARVDLLLRRPDLDVRVGAISDFVIAANSAIGDRILGYASGRFAATYLDGAAGDDLTQLVWDHWRRQREPAVAAIGALTFTRTEGIAIVTIPAGTRAASEPDENGDFLTAETNADLVFVPGDTSLSIPATMLDRGTGGNIGPGKLIRLLDELPAAFTVNNDVRFIGGSAEQSDEELREAVRSLELTQQRATAAAIEFGATQVSTVKAATVVEEIDTGLATVYVTDRDGRSNAQMVADVETELENWRAVGALVQVVGGALVEEKIFVELTVRTGVDVQPLAALVRQAIVGAVNRLAIGQTLYRSLIQAAARAVDTNAILEVDVLQPIANITPSPNEVIRTTPALVEVG